MRLEELFARSSIEVLGGKLWQPHEEAPAASQPAAASQPKRSPPLPSAAADEESPVRRKAAPTVMTKDLPSPSTVLANRPLDASPSPTRRPRDFSGFAVESRVSASPAGRERRSKSLT